MRVNLNCITTFILAIASSAFADSATWNSSPASNDWNTAANWTPQSVPNGPADTATFAVSNKRRGILFPGGGPRKPGVLTMQSTLYFDTSTFAFAVNTRTGLANGVTANGVTLNNAQLTASAGGHFTLPVGTVFTVIHNIAHTLIAGTFTNLPDGGTLTIGSNTFQANYEGGDGNDLTLTVTQ